MQINNPVKSNLLRQLLRYGAMGLKIIIVCATVGLMLLLTGSQLSIWVIGLSIGLAIALIAWKPNNKFKNPAQLLKLDKNSAGANFNGADLSGADLTSVNWSGANLSSANLSHANLSNANLKTADLSHADLSNADLHGANLSIAYLYRVNLKGANLRGASFYSANLELVDLSNANLNDADLRGANLKGVNLVGANLIGVNLSRACVKNSRFGDNLGLSKVLEQDLRQRGAIFLDSSCSDRSSVASCS